jgi:hypothetical protein
MLRTLTIVLSTLVLGFALATSASSDSSGGSHHRTPCVSKQCKRTSARACAKHPSCRHRVERKRKLRAIRPYRAWLRSTGDCENGPYGGPNLRSGLRAYNPSGPFYGRYQFMARTWWATGAKVWVMRADWLEQAYRAVRWRLRIGNPHTSAGWPVCG